MTMIRMSFFMTMIRIRMMIPFDEYFPFWLTIFCVKLEIPSPGTHNLVPSCKLDYILLHHLDLGALQNLEQQGFHDGFMDSHMTLLRFVGSSMSAPC